MAKVSKQRNWSKSRYSFVLKQLHQELKDGQAFEAIIYADFQCSPKGFASQVGQVARDRGLRATCITTDTRVVYRFYSPKSFWRPNLATFPIVLKIRREHARENGQ